MRLHLGLDSLMGGNGGICRVARLMARVAAEEVAAGRLERATACLFSDLTGPADIHLPIRAYGRSRLGFVAACTRAKFTHSHAVYDFVGLAAAHTAVPFPPRPYLAFIHGIEVWDGWTKPKYRKSADQAAVLVSNTAYTRERAGREHPPMNRAIVCWLGTEEEECSPVVPPTGPPRVTIIGRMENERYKGHAELFDAWSVVRTAVPDAVLTVVGRGPVMSDYQARAARLGLPPSAIEFRGFVPESEMPEVWASTHVFAMPSRGEGFGLVYIEAMRQGRPVIGSVHDAAPEVNIDGETGYNVNLDRPDELSERLIYLLRDANRSHQLGLNGQRRWATHFRYSAFRDRFAPILRDFLTR